MKNIRLLIDMDEVLCDFLGELCRKYNALNNASLTTEKISEYDLTSLIGKEGYNIFMRAGFFDCLKPFPHALNVISKLGIDGHDVIIATNALVHISRVGHNVFSKDLFQPNRR